MKVIILSTTKYKEKDCIYNAISKEKSLSFQAKGAQGPKSQFVWLNNVLTVADVEFLQDGRYKYPVLKTASFVSGSMTGNDKLDYLFTLSALAEITNNMFPEEEKYVVFDELIEAIRALKRDKDQMMIILIYLAKCMKFAGAELEVDKCVRSGSRSNIVAFSFSEGGFISEPCLTKDIPTDLTGTQLKLIRYCFKATDYECLMTEQYTKEDKLVIVNKFLEFIDDFLGVKLNTTQYLIK